MNPNSETVINNVKSVRINKNRGMKAWADYLRIGLDLYAAYEAGTHIPSLREIEMLVLFLNVPIISLLMKENKTEFTNLESSIYKNFDAFIRLRNKIKGARINLLRNEKNSSAIDLASNAGICEDDLIPYKIGITPANLSILKDNSDVMSSSFSELFDNDRIFTSYPNERFDPKNFSSSLWTNTLQFLDKLLLDELPHIQSMYWT